MISREAVMTHDFRSAEFLGLSPEELVAKCREYGAEAERLAATASSETRKGYIYLVVQWSVLAEDIQDGIKQGRKGSAHSLAHAA
jgi:hypothetical protein